MNSIEGFEIGFGKSDYTVFLRQAMTRNCKTILSAPESEPVEPESEDD